MSKKPLRDVMVGQQSEVALAAKGVGWACREWVENAEEDEELLGLGRCRYQKI